MNSAVTVVVTCYNLEKYIARSINSVLSQCGNHQPEIIVIDDCSIDGSASIIQSFPGVRYVRTPVNSGVLMATVLGMRESSNDLVFFLDGDDLWHLDKLRLAIACFDRDRTLGLLTHDLEYIDGNGNPISKVSRPSQVMNNSRVTDDELIRTGILLHSDYVWLGSAYAVRTSLIDGEGFCDWAARLPNPFNTYQDWPLAFWAASRPSVRMGYLPEKLFKYRVHGANHSGDSRSAEKAIRNVRRTYHTMEAMQAIGISAKLSDPVMRATRCKLRYYRYVLDLYGGNRLSALSGFFISVPYLFLSTESPIKELFRFIGVQLLGLHRFLAIVNMWTLSRRKIV